MKDNRSDIDTEKLKKEIREELLKRQILTGLEEDEIDLFELFAVLLRQWKLIIFLPIIVGILSAWHSLGLTEYYKADASIYVHSSSRADSILASLPLAGIAGISSGGGGSSQYIMAYLNSRTMSDRIINHFGIATHPKIVGDSFDPDKEIVYERVLRTLRGLVDISASGDGLIKIEVETRCPEFSAEIAQTYIDFLVAFSRGPQKEKREFIERQLIKVEAELQKAEYAIKDFQDKHRIFQVSDQASSLISRYASVEAQKQSAWVSLQMKNRLLEISGNVPELVRIEAEKASEEARIKALEEKLAQLDERLNDVPDLSLEFTRLSRDLAVKEKLHRVLSEQFEMAKISEAEEGSQFEIMDTPRPPDSRSRPARTRMVVMAGLSAGVFSVFAAFLIEFVKRRKKKEDLE